jgi:hypothetical protein
MARLLKLSRRDREARRGKLQPLCLQVFRAFTEIFASANRSQDPLLTLKRALFGGVSHRLTVFIDHLAHLAHALGALGLTALVAEDLGRTAGARVDGGAHFALADAVTVANVQGDNALTE